tara:strand:- start:818 stop:1042 length:225 start_codon:yes stop_codon:yes gene_type:complete
MGYKVRGTVRNVEKASWMQKKFDKSYGKNNFELVPVADLAHEGAFDEAVKGILPASQVVPFHADLVQGYLALHM